MTRRPFLVSSGLAFLAGLALAAMLVSAVASAREPVTVRISVHYAHFSASVVEVPAGRPVTFVLDNTDPIDHEWIVGDEATQERHRTGTEPYHASRPPEVSLDAGTTKTTTITFDRPRVLTFVCHLPGHEAYGMTGTLIVTP